MMEFSHVTMNIYILINTIQNKKIQECLINWESISHMYKIRIGMILLWCYVVLDTGHLFRSLHPSTLNSLSLLPLYYSMACKLNFDLHSMFSLGNLRLQAGLFLKSLLFHPIIIWFKIIQCITWPVWLSA